MQVVTNIATHSGAFHADDVAALAVLQLLYPEARVTRTREPSIIAAADVAVDVGGEWDPARGRFDHHQKGFDGKRANGVVYASAGLVWAEFGVALVQKLAPNLSAADAAAIAAAVDHELMQHLDMADTGASAGAEGYFGLSALVSAFNSTSKEDAALGPQLAHNARNRRFREAVELVQVLLSRVIAQLVDEHLGQEAVRSAPRIADGRILVLPNSGLSWSKVVCNEMPDVLFVLYPDSTDAQYQVRTVPVEPSSFTARKDLPKAWAGLRDHELAAVCGVVDAVFCHNGRFIAGAVSLEGATQMAQLALAT